MVASCALKLMSLKRVATSKREVQYYSMSLLSVLCPAVCPITSLQLDERVACRRGRVAGVRDSSL
jgi:hypothetical protein